MKKVFLIQEWYCNHVPARTGSGTDEGSDKVVGGWVVGVCEWVTVTVGGLRREGTNSEAYVTSKTHRETDY